MLIPFTQYLRPNGRKTDANIQVGQATGDMAKKLINAGAKFEVEELGTGLVSLECINTNVDEDDYMFCLSGQLVPNGPGMKEAVAELVLEAYKRMFGEEDDN